MRSIILRLSITTVVLFILFRSVNLSKIVLLYRELYGFWILASCALILAVRIVMAIRWQYLLAFRNIKVSIRELTRIIFLSTFFGHLLPSAAGADILRGYQLFKTRCQGTIIAGTLILDRFVGLYSMLFLAFAGALAASFLGKSRGMVFPLLALQLVFIIVWLIANRLVDRNGLAFIFNRPKFGAIGSKALMVISSVTNMAEMKRVFPFLFGLSLLTQVLRCGIFYCLYRSLGASTGFIHFLIFIPLVFVILILPFSIGGLGIREGSLVYFFGTLGITNEMSLSAGVLSHILQIILSFPVVVLWISNKYHQKKEVS